MQLVYLGLRVLWLRGVICICLMFVGLLPAVASAADDAAVDDIYGKGAHAYYASNYRQAHDLLTKAIQAGTIDPRAFYFRGLSALHLGPGREPDARLDFQKGAQLEISEGASQAEVAKSLERAQGRSRLILESYRSDARVALARQREQRRLQRYEMIRRAAPAPSGALPPPAAGESLEAPAAKPAAKSDDPFSAPPADDKKADPFGAP